MSKYIAAFISKNVSPNGHDKMASEAAAADGSRRRCRSGFEASNFLIIHHHAKNQLLMPSIVAG
jgi:hypothetical protein